MTIRNLTCSELEARLGDYLERTLEDAGAADVELHLSGCAACAALVRDFEGIVREAAALPSLAPSRDLWPAIEARLVSTRPDSLTPAGRASADTGAHADVIDFAERAAERAANNSMAHDRSRPAFAWRRLRTGALAAGLVAVTAVATWFAARQLPPQTAASAPDNAALPGGDSTLPFSAGTAPAGAAPVASAAAGGDPRGGTPAPQVADGARPSGGAALTPVNRAARPALTATLTQEITALRGVLTDRRDELDPRTVAILESSLSTIDSAITEARRALQIDPASRFLSSQLDKALEQKLGLLRTAALLPART
jgi:Putative zinc-finger